MPSNTDSYKARRRDTDSLSLRFNGVHPHADHLAALLLPSTGPRSIERGVEAKNRAEALDELPSTGPRSIERGVRRAGWPIRLN